MISGGRKIKIFENFEFAQVIAKLGVYRTELDVSKLGMKVIFHSALFIIIIISPDKNSCCEECIFFFKYTEN